MFVTMSDSLPLMSFTLVDPCFVCVCLKMSKKCPKDLSWQDLAGTKGFLEVADHVCPAAGCELKVKEHPSRQGVNPFDVDVVVV